MSGSYQVLARKWRPGDFSAVVGQNPVCEALKNALDQKRLHHAYLFSGTRGVGKTTIARIFARCLSCEKGVTSSPCGTCSNCVELAQGNFIDLLEIDAASRTRVEETREMLQNVVYAPNKGKFKIYLIDEVHMFSNHSFNALLKTLEEPPDHVKFLLATTNPEALPATVVSRCLHFHLRPLPPDHIKSHLVTIVKEEGIAYDDDALELIARKSEGSVRDALGFLDQSIAYCDSHLQAGRIAAILGMIDLSTMLQLLEAVIDEDHEAALKLIKDFAAAGVDFDSALAEMLHRLHQIALVQLSPKSREDLPESLQRLALLADRAAPEDIQLYYQIALYGRRDAAFAADARDAFEMTILRMLAFAPPDQGSRSSRSEPASASAVAKKAEPPPKVEAAPAAAEIVAVEPTAAKNDAPEGETVPDRATEGVADNRDSAPDSAEEWIRLAEDLPLKGPNQQLALLSEFVSCRGGVLSLRLSEKNSHLHSASRLTALNKAVTEASGKELRVEISLVSDGETSISTPQKAINERKTREDQEQGRRFRETHRDLLDTFDATVETKRRD